jgi:hypothetical protein
MARILSENGKISIGWSLCREILARWERHPRGAPKPWRRLLVAMIAAKSHSHKMPPADAGGIIT